jgi:glycosyltransferase involved in cell wall biosynthesis
MSVRMQNARDTSLDIMLWCWGRRGGSVRLAYDFARALTQRHDINLHLSLSRQSELFGATAALGIPGFHVDTYSGILSTLTASCKLPVVATRFNRYVGQLKAPVGICIMRHLWSPAVLGAFRRAGGRVLMVVHDAKPHPGETYPFWQQHLGLDLGVTDGIVVLSEHVRKLVMSLYNYPSERIWLVPHPSLSFAPPRAIPRTLPTDRPARLLFFGRLLAYKGLDVLAEAFLKLTESCQVELCVVGSGKPIALGSLANRSDVRIENRWVAESEIGSILNRADILVAPYGEASQSGVVPSAYRAGVPAVAMPVGGLQEQVLHGVTGLVAARGTVDEFVTTLRQLLADPGLYSRCSAGALQASKGELSARAVTDRLCDAARALASMPQRFGNMESPRGFEPAIAAVDDFARVSTPEV